MQDIEYKKTAEEMITQFKKEALETYYPEKEYCESSHIFDFINEISFDENLIKNVARYKLLVEKIEILKDKISSLENSDMLYNALQYQDIEALKNIKKLVDKTKAEFIKNFILTSRGKRKERDKFLKIKQKCMKQTFYEIDTSAFPQYILTETEFSKYK